MWNEEKMMPPSSIYHPLYTFHHPNRRCTRKPLRRRVYLISAFAIIFPRLTGSQNVKIALSSLDLKLVRDQ
ncbi:hypothetical protein FA95DRAFT_706183 [Auriscalpium vulgare]|uniref:Uncharacterized protein n=1 Tax=Auriscalpium vulgare TaxID=40419 RepID=A0ACB8S2G0_9AGAM|nr:hypothetical protein FA95DRAFT_706183 [Auriscalpium vulgare]